MGDGKAALRVSGGPGNVEVMGAQNLRDIAQRVGSVGLGLALADEDETLPTNGTAHIRGMGRAFAQNLHEKCPFVRAGGIAATTET
jgi:hypothetical protein